MPRLPAGPASGDLPRLCASGLRAADRPGRSLPKRLCAAPVLQRLAACILLLPLLHLRHPRRGIARSFPLREWAAAAATAGAGPEQRCPRLLAHRHACSAGAARPGRGLAPAGPRAAGPPWHGRTAGGAPAGHLPGSASSPRALEGGEPAGDDGHVGAPPGHGGPRARSLLACHRPGGHCAQAPPLAALPPHPQAAGPTAGL
mmetsp:Transcript_50221/g.160801  ORF Transcript_50221/g.160801 Transcript_50221/m.160801 type:complete len:202 (-) Transcript_50221:630-1235(-)